MFSFILYLAIIEDTARPSTADNTIPADASEHTLNVAESNGSLTSKLSYENCYDHALCTDPVVYSALL